MAEYSFEPFLNEIQGNWYEDDELLQRLLARFAPDVVDSAESELKSWGAEVSGYLRELAEESARPENAPSLKHFDAYNNRVDEIVLPQSTLEAQGVVCGRERLGAVRGDPFVFYSKIYLFTQNSEAGVGCSLACTDGLVRVLEALGDRPEHAEAVEKIRNSTYEEFYHGAQFVTEIQGGSDVPANLVRAVFEGDCYRLHGHKWFCSNITADYFIVTARPDGAPEGGRGVGLFLVPAYIDEQRGQRNGYVLHRLKDKLGTRELATAELTFEGAVAYPIGPLDKGIANLIQHVLVPSRFACILNATAYLRQAERIASTYAKFRMAFGVPISEFPTVSRAVEEIKLARERGLAMIFRLLDLWERTGNSGSENIEAFDFRVMMSLAKTVLTRRSAALIHEAMMILGGNGIEERFSPLPRLYRDAVILETWEGPHNMLLSQALRDMNRFEFDVSEFVARIAGPNHSELVDALNSILGSNGSQDPSIEFVGLSEKLVNAMADHVLAQLEAAPVK